MRETSTIERFDALWNAVYDEKERLTETDSRYSAEETSKLFFAGVLLQAMNKLSEKAEKAEEPPTPIITSEHITFFSAFFCILKNMRRGSTAHPTSQTDKPEIPKNTITNEQINQVKEKLQAQLTRLSATDVKYTRQRSSVTAKTALFQLILDRLKEDRLPEPPVQPTLPTRPPADFDYDLFEDQRKQYRTAKSAYDKTCAKYSQELSRTLTLIYSICRITGDQVLSKNDIEAGAPFFTFWKTPSLRRVVTVQLPEDARVCDEPAVTPKISPALVNEDGNGDDSMAMPTTTPAIVEGNAAVSGVGKDEMPQTGAASKPKTRHVGFDFTITKTIVFDPKSEIQRSNTSCRP